jgi:membrane protease subunit HflK
MIVYQRGKNVAILGAILQFILAAVMVTIGLRTDFVSAMTLAYFLGAGTLAWLMAALLFYCYQLRSREEIEISELTASGADSNAIFEAGSPEMRQAVQRVAFMEKWIAPGFTVVWAIILACLGLLEFRYLNHQSATADPTSAPAALFTVMAAFVAFLFSRYAVGMSERVEWRLLRATGSFLTANVIFLAGVSIILLADTQGNFDLAAAYAIAVVQIVIAAELLLNFVLDIYRPRVSGQESRFSFDSRLLNLIAQPGRIGHSLAEAINYQFGFEVSKSWFYQLLGRALLPMIIFGAIIMLAMSSVLVVNEGEQYVVLHLGQPAASGPVSSGLHFKWPWPIDTARRFETGKIHEILLGVGQPRSPQQRASAFVKGKELYLWKEDHGPMEEKEFLIAAPRNVASAGTSDAPPINVIMLVVRVQYKITDPVQYGLKFENPDELLKCLSNREMVKYCASATLDQPIAGDEGQRPAAIMTSGRSKAALALKDKIQHAADDVAPGGMGVEIIYVGLDAVHPPKDVAPTAEKVLEAERMQDSQRYQAEAEANSLLALTAGDPATALKLALAIRQKDELSSLQDFMGNAGEFQRRLKDDIRRAQDDVTAGASLAGAAAKDDLARRYQEYLTNLQAIQQTGTDNDQAKLGTLLATGLTVASKSADDLLDQAQGYSATRVAQAMSDRWGRELAERGKAEAFKNQLAAYTASPEVYMVDHWLDVWDEVLPGITKYVLAVDRDKVQIWLDWTLSAQPMSGIYDSGQEKK